jgi:hypothetical protein
MTTIVYNKIIDENMTEMNKQSIQYKLRIGFHLKH